MRKWIHRFHLYGGLLCFPYLIMFGFSSLCFNHNFAFIRPEPTVVSWEEAVQVPQIEDNLQLAMALRDSLGLMGYTPNPDIKRDSAGGVAFSVVRNGKRYVGHYDPQRKLAQVEETRFGFWRVFNGLHMTGKIPNSSFSWVGWVSMEVCTVFGLLAGISGIVLWAQGRREKLSGTLVFFGTTGLSLLFMLYVWLRG